MSSIIETICKRSSSYLRINTTQCIYHSNITRYSTFPQVDSAFLLNSRNNVAEHRHAPSKTANSSHYNLPWKPSENRAGCHHRSIGARAASHLLINKPTNQSRAGSGVSGTCTYLAASLTTKQITPVRHFSLTTTEMGLKELQEQKEKFTPPADLGTKVPVADVRRFMVECLTASGVEEAKAGQLADVLVAADDRGHYSHGLNRLEMYVNDCRSGICAGNANPTTLKESVSTALVTGNNGLGPVIGNYCMDLAIAKAKETGIGWVCARGSNHYGIAGWYAMRASDQGLIGMSFTNTSPLVAPTRAKKAALGTNPLSLAAPGKDKEDPFVLDMATCTVALGKIEVQRRKNEPIPNGWALDSEGRTTNDAGAAMSGALMPLGGEEANSGYKGYGLAMMVEIFCGLLSGGQYGPNVRRWMDTTKEADLGQCFMAIDPSFFAPGFPDRMSDLMGHCRNMEPADPGSPVLAAGDPERAHIAKVAAAGGITYHRNQIDDSWKLAQLLKVSPMAGV